MLRTLPKLVKSRLLAVLHEKAAPRSGEVNKLIKVRAFPHSVGWRCADTHPTPSFMGCDREWLWEKLINNNGVRMCVRPPPPQPNTRQDRHLVQPGPSSVPHFSILHPPSFSLPLPFWIRGPVVRLHLGEGFLHPLRAWRNSIWPGSKVLLGARFCLVASHRR